MPQINKTNFLSHFSFLLLPPQFPGGTLGILFMFIAVMIAFMINDSLEHAWGVFRTSVYCFGVMLCQIVGLTVLSLVSIPMAAMGLSTMGGVIFYEAIFLAFATVYPRYEFRLFFILPVQVWVLGVIAGILIVLQSISLASLGFHGILQAIYLYFVLLPYLVWAVPRLIRYSKERGQTAARRAKFQQKSLPASESFHKCEQCGATDASHPERDFRITEDERELCDSCLESQS